MRVSPDTASKPWVDWFAGRIHDPITRLRFLRAVAPPLDLQRNRRAGLARLMLPGLVLILLTGLTLVEAGGHPRRVSKSVPPPRVTRPTRNPAFSEVWLVERNDSFEIYSNGLRIDNRYLVSNRPRSYLVFALHRGKETSGIRRSEPAGVVFHATQSRQAPFAADQTGLLKKIGESLLEYVQRIRAYHFLIDRFGRVYRVVAESDSANHAGNSVWADEQWLYLNLNQSFLGVALEAESRPGWDGVQEELEMSPAQVRAAGMLTEMLRSRYRIRVENCVTHAQVSVNPANMRLGYHTDWASGFPFQQLGLPDNYAEPLPALGMFGFEYDPDFERWAGDRLRVGLQAGEAELVQGAGAAGESLRAYRKSLQNQYREQLSQVRRANTLETGDSE